MMSIFMNVEMAPIMFGNDLQYAVFIRTEHIV